MERRGAGGWISRDGWGRGFGVRSAVSPIDGCGGSGPTCALIGDDDDANCNFNLFGFAGSSSSALVGLGELLSHARFRQGELDISRPPEPDIL